MDVPVTYEKAVRRLAYGVELHDGEIRVHPDHQDFYDRVGMEAQRLGRVLPDDLLTVTKGIVESPTPLVWHRLLAQ